MWYTRCYLWELNLSVTESESKSTTTPTKMKIVRSFNYLVVLVVITIITLYAISLRGLNDNLSERLYMKKCNSTVHVGTVLIGYNSTYKFYTSLKFIFLTRNSSIHFHIISDDISRKSLDIMFIKWKIPAVTVEYYDVKLLSPTKQIKLSFLDIVDSSVVNKIIVFDPDAIFKYKVYEVWSLFGNFNDNQVIGLLDSGAIDMQIKSFEADLILYHIEHLTKVRQEKIKTLLSDTKSIQSSKEAFNVIARTYPELVYNISYNLLSASNVLKRGTGKIINAITQYDGSLLKNFSCYLRSERITADQRPTSDCSDFEESIAYSWRILPYVTTFEPDLLANVTFVSHLTFDRIYMLQKLSSRWSGPMSFALYVTDAELAKTLDLIGNTASLVHRSNIAYNVVFKERNLLHPINLCRNTAWKYSVTPYVFLTDGDFIPMQDMDVVLNQYLVEQKNMVKKVLVVPAFQNRAKLTSEYPKTREEVLKLLNKGILEQFLFHFYDRGHTPTNYTLWKTAWKPYKINWQPGYEPYTVIDYNTVKFNERFVGYGWDKISHNTHLHLLGYEFIVLPNTFAVHRDHHMSVYAKQHLNTRYRQCLHQVIVEKVINELRQLCQCALHEL